MTPRIHNRLVARRAQRGMTLLEIMLSIALLVMGITALSRLTISVTRTANMQRETELATGAARAMIERVQAEAFAQAFRSFNATSTDDPGGTVTPGAHFAVLGLRPTPDDPDGLPGEIIFPSPAGQPAQLCENVTEPKLGMPQDLNGDGHTDASNHATDYKLLPLLVRVRWQSQDGVAGTVELKTFLSNF